MSGAVAPPPRASPARRTPRPRRPWSPPRPRPAPSVRPRGHSVPGGRWRATRSPGPDGGNPASEADSTRRHQDPGGRLRRRAPRAGAIRQSATEGGPADVVEALAGAGGGGAGGRGRGGGGARRRGRSVRRGAIDAPPALSVRRATCRTVQRSPSRSPGSWRSGRACGDARQRRVGRAWPQRFQLGARATPTRCSACSGARASAAASCSTASCGSAATPPARSATWWSRSAARVPCGRRG